MSHLFIDYAAESENESTKREKGLNEARCEISPQNVLERCAAHQFSYVYDFADRINIGKTKTC